MPTPTPDVVPVWVQIVGIFASPAMLALILLLFNSRFSDLNKHLNQRIDDVNTGLNARFDDLRNQMQREHDSLSKKVDKLLESINASD